VHLNTKIAAKRWRRVVSETWAFFEQKEHMDDAQDNVLFSSQRKGPQY